MDLKLNDFEGFNRYLFGEEEPDWSTLYITNDDMFIPPIAYPNTEAEHQLCHYALWMTMSKCTPEWKPNIFGVIRNRCYACEWKKRCGHLNDSCDAFCPFTSIQPSTCDPALEEWVKLDRRTYKDLLYFRKLAEKIARIPWREVE